jgi:hypothetical protein
MFDQHFMSDSHCGYCVTLWIMGRRDDIIYGQFIQTEQFPAVNLELRQPQCAWT